MAADNFILVVIFLFSYVHLIYTYDTCFIYEDLHNNYPLQGLNPRYKIISCREEHEVCCMNEVGCCLKSSSSSLIWTAVFVSLLVFAGVFTLVVFYACCKALWKRFIDSHRDNMQADHRLNHNISLHLDLSRTQFSNQHMAYTPGVSPLTPITPPPIYSVAIFLPMPALGNNSPNEYDKIPTYEQAIAVSEDKT